MAFILIEIVDRETGDVVAPGLPEAAPLRQRRPPTTIASKTATARAPSEPRPLRSSPPVAADPPTQRRRPESRP
jgi:hypothetical protein